MGFVRITMLHISLLLLLLSHTASSSLLGWVESPGYPSGYLPEASLNWSRCAPEGHTLSIRLIHLDLEDSRDCENDAVKVFSNGRLISILCGRREFEDLQSSVNPILISSPGGCLSLTFHSDYSNTERHSGFRGFYTVQDFDECEDDPENECTQFCHNTIGGYHCSCRHGYHLDTDKHTCTVGCSEDLSGLTRGEISTPSWPGSYAENANCQYTLSVDAHLQLELHFSEGFDVEQSPDGQCIDALRIETFTGTLGPFCGSDPPPSPLLTDSHKILIHFTSDGFGSNKGFNLHFTTTDKVCPAVVSPQSSVTPQQAEYHQGQRVTVTCDVGHVVNSHDLDEVLSQYETTCQSTGVWYPAYVCKPVNCGIPPIPANDILQLVDSDTLRTKYTEQIHFNCSSIYYRLEGDDTYTCSAKGEWQSSSGETVMPKCKEVCGEPESVSTSVGRILGGQNAKMKELPWHLLIKWPSRGGASLISDRWAVTAAHVVERETSLELYGGIVEGEKANNDSLLKSNRIIIHPGYNRESQDRTNFNNDIALIRLDSRVNLRPNLLPICLPERNRALREGEQGTVSGFGVAERGLSRKLKYATIGVYDQRTCQATPSLAPNKPMIFTSNMFCAGAEGKDSCEKDSGGPFVVPMLTQGGGPYSLAGIVSWGSPCKERRYKGYYVRVANYVDWIRDTIERTERGE